MKIAIDISPISPDSKSFHKVRGVGMYIKNLTENLQKLDKKNDYIFFENDKKLPKNIELIHYPYFDPFFFTLPLTNKKKTVVTVHDLTPIIFKKHFPAGIRGNVKWILQKNILKKVNKIITDSESSKKDIERLVGINAEKISVVYLAPGEKFKRLEIGDWKLATKKKFGLPADFILYVGDVTWNKNLPRLIEAVKNTDIPLVMVGKALSVENFEKTNIWNADLIKVLHEIKGNNQFIRLGFVEDDDLVKLYNLATVFVMPSLYEGFGLPVVEAMRCGCPVITSERGSLKEVAGDAAIYVNPEDVKDIKSKIEKVFESFELQKQLSLSGIKQANKFSWEKTARETISVYENI